MCTVQNNFKLEPVLLLIRAYIYVYVQVIVMPSFGFGTGRSAVHVHGSSNQICHEMLYLPHPPKQPKQSIA